MFQDVPSSGSSHRNLGDRQRDTEAFPRLEICKAYLAMTSIISGGDGGGSSSYACIDRILFQYMKVGELVGICTVVSAAFSLVTI